MFSNVAIDVVLGLVFIFFLYSLLASILQEILARWFGLRARTLLKALRRMLEDGDSRFDSTLVNFFIDMGTNIVDYFRPLKKQTFLKAFYDHPTIKYLGENNTNSKPSYIDATSFSKTIIQILRGLGYNQSLNQMQSIRNNLQIGHIDDFTINPETLASLTRQWMDASNDIDHFRLNLEEWFNNTMDRATGWYKKQTQLLLFLIGWVVAINFNVDAIAITKILANNEGVRKELVNLAVDQQQKYAEVVKAQKDSIITDQKTGQKTIIKYVTLNEDQLGKITKSLETDAFTTQRILGLGDRDKLTNDVKIKYQSSLLIANIGWLLTALAISLGAPFWFDMLNKVMMLRNAGDKPNESNKGNNQLTPPIQPVG